MGLEAERLRVFRAVAREGSFSRAAARLHRTQPAISQAIRALEEEIGEALIVRLGRSNALTEAGRLLLQAAEDSARVLEEGLAQLEARRALLRGELVIGTSDTTACYLLPPVLARFRARHPAIELRIANRPSPRTAEQVRAREVDLGLVTLPLPVTRGLRVERLMEREDVAILPPDHALAHRRRLSPSDLLDHPLVLLDRGSQTRHLIDRALRDQGRPPHIAMELASIEVVKRMVTLGFGVSIVPAVAVEAEVGAGTLLARPILPRKAQRALGAVTVDRGSPSPAAAAFLAIAREMLGRAAGGARPSR